MKLFTTPMNNSGGSRISSRWGRQLSRGRQHKNLSNFRKNCTKFKEFGPPRGRAYLAPLLDKLIRILIFPITNIKISGILKNHTQPAGRALTYDWLVNSFIMVFYEKFLVVLWTDISFGPFIGLNG